MTLQLAKRLQASGRSVLVVTHRHPATLARRASVEGVAVFRVPFDAPSSRPRPAARFAFGQLGVQRALDSLRPRPAVVHVHCPSSQTLPLVIYAARHKVPLVLTSHGEVAMDADRLYQKSLYMRVVFRLAARRALALTACSAWTSDQCLRYSSRFTNAKVIPNGVEPRDWDMGPPPEGPVLCAWGRHAHEKGFDLAISAFAVLRRRVSDARLLLGGDGPETARLRRLAGEGVELLGALDRDGVRALLQMARVAVVPSRIEPFGIVALEALAAGRGLVYAQGTGLAEAVGGLGRPADVGDPQALADAMEAELSDPTAPAAGRARAQELSWEHVCDLYLDVYSEVTARRPAHR